MNKIPPESSKNNPKHQRLDKYLEDRNLFDKAKDSIYNYIKKKVGDNSEVSEKNMEKYKSQNRGLVDERPRVIESEKEE